MAVHHHPERPDDSGLAEKYKRTVAEMAELAGGLAHELRNPLSTMMINLKLLAEDLRDTTSPFEDVRRRALLKVEVLRRESQRLQSLFDEFLNLTGPCRLRPEPTDLNLIVDRLVEFFAPLAQSKGIEVRLDRAETPVRCVADEKLLSQALLNIVVNAQEAMPDGGILRLSVGQGGGCATVAVSDTGVGIAPEDRERIWRPFFSIKASGTGLGLSLTQQIISEHGGRLDFESELGRGTTFTIRLPLDAGDSRPGPTTG